MKNKLVIGCCVLAVCVVVLTILVGLKNGSSIQIGFSESTVGDQVSASFKYFNGVKKEKVKFSAGSDVVMNYKISAKSGKLKMEIVDGSGNVIKEIKAPEEGEFEFSVVKKQKYVLRFTGKKARGKYKVSWKKK